MGSSPMSSAVVDSFASAYPLVFRLYPRLSTAISNLDLNVLISSSTIGDLPVPPTARFPTQIIGRLKAVEERSFLSKHQLRIFTTSAYSSETGNKSILIGLSNGKLNFIIQIHRNGDLRLWIKIHQIYWLTPNPFRRTGPISPACVLTNSASGEFWNGTEPIRGTPLHVTISCS